MPFGLGEAAAVASIASSGTQTGFSISSLFGGGSRKKKDPKTPFTFPWGGTLYTTPSGNYPNLVLIGYHPITKQSIPGWDGQWRQVDASTWRFCGNDVARDSFRGLIGGVIIPRQGGWSDFDRIYGGMFEGPCQGDEIINAPQGGPLVVPPAVAQVGQGDGPVDSNRTPLLQKTISTLNRFGQVIGGTELIDQPSQRRPLSPTLPTPQLSSGAWVVIGGGFLLVIFALLLFRKG